MVDTGWQFPGALHRAVECWAFSPSNGWIPELGYLPAAATSAPLCGPISPNLGTLRARQLCGAYTDVQGVSIGEKAERLKLGQGAGDGGKELD